MQRRHLEVAQCRVWSGDMTNQVIQQKNFEKRLFCSTGLSMDWKLQTEFVFLFFLVTALITEITLIKKFTFVTDIAHITNITHNWYYSYWCNCCYYWNNPYFWKYSHYHHWHYPLYSHNKVSLVFLFTDITRIAKLVLSKEICHVDEATIITHIAQSSLIHFCTYIIHYPYYWFYKH